MATHPAADGVASALERDLDTCIMLVGDSTGDTSDEWFGLLGQKIGLSHPGHDIASIQWVGGSFQRYSGLSYLQKAAAGRRFVSLQSGGYLQLAGPSVIGDLELRLKICPQPDWTPAAGQTIASKYNSVGNLRGWALNINPSGSLTLNWSTNGTALFTATSSVSLTTVATTGQPLWLRMTFDADNGAGGRTVKFSTAPGTLDYPSLAAGDWTQLGSDVVSAGVSSIFDNTSVPYTLGGQANGTNLFNGDIYWLDVRSGLDGHNVIAPMPNAYDVPAGVSSDLVSFGGSPTVLLVNGSEGGQNVAYWDNATRRPKLAFQAGQQLILLSSAHNDGQPTGSGMFPTFKSFLDNLKALLPFVPIVGLSQNQTQVGTVQTAGAVLRHKRRTARLMSFYASQSGVWGLDTYPAFTNLATQLDADGLHVTPAGSEVWAELVHQSLFV